MTGLSVKTLAEALSQVSMDKAYYAEWTWESKRAFRLQPKLLAALEEKSEYLECLEKRLQSGTRTGSSELSVVSGDKPREGREMNEVINRVRMAIDQCRLRFPYVRLAEQKTWIWENCVAVAEVDLWDMLNYIKVLEARLAALAENSERLDMLEARVRELDRQAVLDSARVEAARALLTVTEPVREGEITFCTVCGGTDTYSKFGDVSHRTDCEWLALKSALDAQEEV